MPSAQIGDRSKGRRQDYADQGESCHHGGLTEGRLHENESLNGRITIFRGFSVASFKRMEEKDRKRFIRAGFALVEAERRAHPKYHAAGYFPTVWLPDYLAVKLPLPNVSDRKYRTPDGNNLNEAFFEDTVTSALEWWAIHRKDYE
jgi:hypothetical protein